MTNSITRECSKCGEAKALNAFYTRSQSNVCKDCTRTMGVKKREAQKTEKCNCLFCGESFYTTKDKISRGLGKFCSHSCHMCFEHKDSPRPTAEEKRLARWYIRDYRERNPDKIPANCSSCGIETKLNAHHRNYKLPFRVCWLCSKCHDAIHRGYQIKVVEVDLIG